MYMGAVVCYVVSTKKFEKVVEVVWRWMSPEGRRQIFCCVFSNLENIGIHLEKNWKNYTEGLWGPSSICEYSFDLVVWGFC